jgi:hypothetical protein
MVKLAGDKHFGLLPTLINYGIKKSYNFGPRSGKQWSKLFAKRNSGTYNNQWMVLDYKKFVPGKDLSDVKGLLWVLEQLPGT